MSAKSCEKCWGDAFRLSLLGQTDQVTEYSQLLRMRKSQPCSPRDQAGQWWCEKCEQDKRDGCECPTPKPETGEKGVASRWTQEWICHGMTEQDQEFVVAARTDLPLLLRYVRELENQASGYSNSRAGLDNAWQRAVDGK